jgi:hypothetical protein
MNRIRSVEERKPRHLGIFQNSTFFFPEIRKQSIQFSNNQNSAQFYFSMKFFSHLDN